MAVVAALHSSHHVGLLTTDAVDELVVSYLDAFPAFVTVHGVETADDRRYVCTGAVTHALQVFDETLAAARIRIAAVHEAVHEGAIGHAVLFGYLHQFEEMVERTVDTAVGAEAHDMQFLACRLCCLIRCLNLGVLHDRVVADGAIDLHEVLIDHATGAYVQVPHFGVTHLSVRQTYILAACLELRVWVLG